MDASTVRCDEPSCDKVLPDAARRFICGGCRSSIYCGPDCQRHDWGAHKGPCRTVQAINAKTVAAAPLLAPGAARPFAPSLAAARAGDAGAQYDVAGLYASGTGVARDSDAAFMWYRRSAAQAGAPVEVWVELGKCYERGHGTAVDEAEAVRHYRIGADKGDSGAQFQLGQCLLHGTGCDPDFPAAVALFHAAEAQRHAGALYTLGHCYATGKGVAQDIPRAIAYYERHIAHPKSSPSVVADSKSNLGGIYMDGEGVPRNVDKAVRLLREAAAAGNATAAEELRRRGL